MHKLMDPRDTNDYEAQASGRGRSPLSAGNGHMLAVDNFPPSRAAFGSGGSASHDPLGCKHHTESGRLRLANETGAPGANEHSRSPRAGALDPAISDTADGRHGASSMASVLAGRRPSG